MTAEVRRVRSTAVRPSAHGKYLETRYIRLHQTLLIYTSSRMGLPGGHPGAQAGPLHPTDSGVNKVGKTPFFHLPPADSNVKILKVTYLLYEGGRARELTFTRTVADLLGTTGPSQSYVAGATKQTHTNTHTTPPTRNPNTRNYQHDCFATGERRAGGCDA